MNDPLQTSPAVLAVTIERQQEELGQEEDDDEEVEVGSRSRRRKTGSRRASKDESRKTSRRRRTRTKKGTTTTGMEEETNVLDNGLTTRTVTAASSTTKNMSTTRDDDADDDRGGIMLNWSSYDDDDHVACCYCPSEKFIVSCIFCLLGIGYLTPWNAFISAKGYFSSRFCQQQQQQQQQHDGDDDGNLDNDDDDPDVLESTFAMVYNLSSVLSLLLILLVQGFRDQCDIKMSNDRKNQNDHNSSNHYGRDQEEEEDQQQSQQMEPIMNVTKYHEGRALSATSPSATTSSSVVSSSSSSATSTSSSGNSRNHAAGHAFSMVMIPLSLYAAVFCGQTILVLFHGESISTTFVRRFTIISLGLCGICGAIASAGIAGTAGLFDAKLAMNPYIAGQSVGGVVVAVASFIAAVWEDPDVYWEANCDSPSSTRETKMDDNHNNSFYTYVNGSMTRRFLEDDIETLSVVEEGTAATSCVPYEEIDWAVFGYFFLGTFVLVLCVLGYAYIDRYQKMEHRDDYVTIQDVSFQQQSHQQHEENQNHHVKSSFVEESKNIETSYQKTIPSSSSSLDKSSPTKHHVIDNSPRVGLEMQQQQRSRLVDESEEGDSESHDQEDRRQQQQQQQQYCPVDAANAQPATVGLDHTNNNININNETIAVWYHVRESAMSIFFNFFVTLSIFPVWTSMLQSIHACEENTRNNRFMNDLYTPMTFVLFNCGDLLGRILSSYLPIHTVHNFSTKLLWFSIGRLLFFPLFYMCNTNSSSNDDDVAIVDDDGTNQHHLMMVNQIQSDLFSIMIQLWFAITNGMVMNLAFVYAPTTVPPITHVQERVSEILSLCVYAGLLAGSFMSFPIGQFVN